MPYYIYLQLQWSIFVYNFSEWLLQYVVSDLMNFPVLQFDCSSDVTLMEVRFSLVLLFLVLNMINDYVFIKDIVSQEQFFIMKPKEMSTRSFKLYPPTDQAAKYVCAGKMSSGSHRW